MLIGSGTGCGYVREGNAVCSNSGSQKFEHEVTPALKEQIQVHNICWYERPLLAETWSSSPTWLV